MLDQIKSTKSTVKAVLLVGGFGQSAYLRDRIRAAVSNIEVMQSPNGYNITSSSLHLRDLILIFSAGRL